MDSWSKRLHFLHEQYGDALLAAFAADPRNHEIDAGITDAGASSLAVSRNLLFQRYRGADPTLTGACTQWLVRLAIAGGLPAEDLPKARETLEAFQTYKRRLPSEQRDLGRYGSLGDVWEAVAPFVAENAPVSGKDEERREREEVRAESDILLEQDGWIVAIPKTERASKWWGRGTRWCTAADANNMFGHYDKAGPLVVFVRPDGAKFQWHGQSDAFMDGLDREAVAGRALVDLLPLLVKGSDLHRALLMLLAPSASITTSQIGTGLTETTALLALSALKATLDQVPEALRTRNVCLHAVRQHGSNLKVAPRAQRTRDICLAAVRNNGYALPLVPDDLIDQEMCLEAVKSGKIDLEHVPTRLRSREICTLAVAATMGNALEHVPPELADRDICQETVRLHGYMLKYVPMSLRDREMCLAAVTSDLRGGWALEYVPENLRDQETCLAAVRCHGLALQWTPFPLRDRTMCEIAISTSKTPMGLALQWVPAHLCDREMCLAAVRENGWAVHHVPDGILDEEICLTAIRDMANTIEAIPERFKTHAVCLEAVSLNGSMLRYVPEEQRVLEICIAAVRQGGSLRFDVPRALIPRVEEAIARSVDATAMAAW